MGLRRAPGTRCTSPVLASPIQSSTESGAIFTNANRFPSAAHMGAPGHAPAGSATWICAPSAMCTSSKLVAQGVMPYPPGVSCLLWFFGSTRTPARRKKGVATREIDGYFCQDTRRIVSCVGLTAGIGGEGACITSRIFFGGWLYPDEVPTGLAVAEAAFDENAVDCAAIGTDIALAKSAPDKRRFNAFRTGIRSLRFS